MGVPFRAVGLLAVLWAWLRLRGLGPPIARRRLGFAAASLGIAAGLLLVGAGGLALLALLLATVSGAQGLLLLADDRAWSFSTLGWRRVVRAAGVVFGAAVAVCCTDWLRGGESFDDPAFVLVGAAWLAVPALFAARAASLSARDERQASGQTVPAWVRWTAGRCGALLLSAVLLLPLWLLLPLSVHYAFAPSFAEAARATRARWKPPPLPGVECVAAISGRTWAWGHTVAPRLDPDAPPFDAAEQSVARRFRFDLRHGAQDLLGAEVELLLTFDPLRGKLLGARCRIPRLRATEGFRPVVRARFDVDGARSGTAGGGDRVLRCPFALSVVLLAGSGTEEVRIERVRGLPRDRLLPLEGVEPKALPWFLPQVPGLRGVVGSAPGADAAGGLRYALLVQGSLEARQDGLARQQPPSLARLRASTLEYSYAASLRETVIAQDAQGSTRSTRSWHWEHRLRWAGRVW
ncbi:MAG: hypothetical protein D6731_00850 [Planctomycetota bacterium]|nr:MAG: hypothetical protein D6731_00850 [Planctomycetota bacterium]